MEVLRESGEPKPTFSDAQWYMTECWDRALEVFKMELQQGTTPSVEAKEVFFIIIIILDSNFRILIIIFQSGRAAESGGVSYEDVEDEEEEEEDDEIVFN